MDGNLWAQHECGLALMLSEDFQSNIDESNGGKGVFKNGIRFPFSSTSMVTVLHECHTEQWSAMPTP